jgi:hypothetical protein
MPAGEYDVCFLGKTGHGKRRRSLRFQVKADRDQSLSVSSSQAV